MKVSTSPDSRIWHQRAVRVGISSDQKRHLIFAVKAVKQDDSFVSRTKQVPRLKAQAEGGTGNLRDKKVALLEPFHIPPVDILWADRPVSLPGVVADQMTREHFMTEFLE